MSKNKEIVSVEDFYFINIKHLWRSFSNQTFAYWSICAYLFFEFVRPQSLVPSLDVLPWAKLCLISSLLFSILDKGITWVRSTPNIWMIMFLTAILLSWAFSYYPEYSKFHLMDFIGWFVIYFIIINVVNTRERFYIFLLIYIISAAKIAIGTTKIWALRGFSFTTWGLVGPPGFFQNSGELAVLMIMLFPLTYYMFIWLRPSINLWQKILLITFFVCPVITTLGASSRGAQVALAVQIAFMFRKHFFNIKKLAFILVLISTLFYILPQEQKDRFSDAGDDKTSQQRFLYWEHGWEMMKENPFFGVGFYNFIPYYNDYYPHDTLYGSAQLPHNIFIQVGTDTGFIGLSIFLAILLSCATMTKNIQKKGNSKDPFALYISTGLAYGVLGFVISGQFVTITYYPFLWIHLALLSALSNIVLNKRVLQAS